MFTAVVIGQSNNLFFVGRHSIESHSKSYDEYINWKTRAQVREGERRFCPKHLQLVDFVVVVFYRGKI